MCSVFSGDKENKNKFFFAFRNDTALDFWDLGGLLGKSSAANSGETGASLRSPGASSCSPTAATPSSHSCVRGAFVSRCVDVVGQVRKGLFALVFFLTRVLGHHFRPRNFTPHFICVCVWADGVQDVNSWRYSSRWISQSHTRESTFKTASGYTRFL